jgi:hypothetical protein
LHPGDRGSIPLGSTGSNALRDYIDGSNPPRATLRPDSLTGKGESRAHLSILCPERISGDSPPWYGGDGGFDPRSGLRPNARQGLHWFKSNLRRHYGGAPSGAFTISVTPCRPLQASFNGRTRGFQPRDGGSIPPACTALNAWMGVHRQSTFNRKIVGSSPTRSAGLRTSILERKPKGKRSRRTCQGTLDYRSATW